MNLAEEMSQKTKKAQTKKQRLEDVARIRENAHREDLAENARIEALAAYPRYVKLIESAADRGETETLFDIRLDNRVAWLTEATEVDLALLNALRILFLGKGFRVTASAGTTYGSGSDPGPPSHSCRLHIAWSAP